MSNRKSVLAALQKNGQSTYDDLEQSTGLDRYKLRIAVNDAKVARHLTASRDEVTGAPAYKITAAGAAWLKSNQRDSVCTESQTEPAPKLHEGCQRSHPHEDMDDSCKQKTIQAARDNELANLRASLKLAEQQRDDHFSRAESLQLALQNLDVQLGIIGTMLINIKGENLGEKLGKVLHDNLHSTQRISDLEFAVDAAQQTIHQLELEAEQYEKAIDVKDAAEAYLVVSPKRKPAKFTKPENAVAKAKAAAKATGRSEVFALVSVGVATRKQIKAVEFKERAA